MQSRLASIRLGRGGEVESNAGIADVATRFRMLQSYVDWSERDAERIRELRPLLEPHLAEVVTDFYAAIDRYEATRRVLRGGSDQSERLREALKRWLWDLLSGPYDSGYVSRRWRAGWRHVEIGLPAVFTHVAMARLRFKLAEVLRCVWPASAEQLNDSMESLNKLLDLDLALIEDAYQTELSARLQANERLAVLGQVAGGVAHELRNPLNVVATSVYFLQHARNLTPEKMTEHLKRIERQVGLADSVITALARFARLPQPARSVAGLRGLVQDVLDTIVVPEQVRVEWDWPAEDPQVLVDVDQFRIVLSNLFRNACEAMPNGGVLRFRAQGSRDSGMVDLSVQDTGEGIPEEHLTRVLEPMFSTKPRGLGLGLAIARAIVERNGGHLSVTSQVGAGSTFLVRLEAAGTHGEGGESA
jgi:signal transduction histidine kinase